MKHFVSIAMLLLLFAIATMPPYDNILIYALVIVGIYNTTQTRNSIPKIFLLYLLPPVVLILCASRGYESFHDFISEFKIFSILYLPSAVDLILRWVKFTPRNLRTVIQLLFAIYLLTGIYGTLFLGWQRVDALGFSIYVSYSFSIFLIGTCERLPQKAKFLGAVSCLFLGSRTGLLTYLISWTGNLGSKSPRYYRLLIALPVILGIGFIYSLNVRGQDLSSTKDLDRVNIINGATDFMKRNFTAKDYLIGYGPGNELKGFTTHSDLDYWIDGDFTPRGTFSFILHNEYLRIFFDYGIIGLIGFLIIAFSTYDKWLIISLLLAMTTNSVFFSSIILLSLAYSQVYINHVRQSEIANAG